MAFNPNSSIYLCNVPFDSTYKHQVYFKSKNEQQGYFSQKVVKVFQNYLTVRKALPDGGNRSSIKVDANIDEIRSLPCNYMFYQNQNHGTKFFYAFITDIIYINEGTTELVFETDVFQTWLFDVEIKPSYVVREHSNRDTIGSNVVPEKFNFNEYVYEEIFKDTNLNEWGYLVATTEQKGTDGSRGKQMSGIYQGLYFYYYYNENNLNDFLNAIEEEGGDCVQFIAVIPKFCLRANPIGDGDNDEGWVGYSDKPASATIGFNFHSEAILFNGYIPVNKKIFTSPFFKLLVTNHNGEQAEYNIEDFSYGSGDGKRIEFTMYGDVSANPSITLVPKNYKDITENFDAGISISGFPQCSFNSDTYKLWLAKNQFSMGLDTLGNLGNIAMGLGAMATGAGAGFGGMQVMHGVTGILGTLNSNYQARKEPNKSHAGCPKNNLITATGYNRFSFFWQKLKKEYIKTIDDFFTMYGYQTNEVKEPNLSSRPYFNYIQTVDVNIVGGIPADDMERLKQIYNNGVTLWKAKATMYDYSVDNTPQ